MHVRDLAGRPLLGGLLPLLMLLAAPAAAQRPPEQPDAARILHEMQKLNMLGTVLYIAAHPDDENTRLIAWLANGKKVRTGYLSLTRGEGGQNLIGPELGDALGIIRTQELLEARRIDGGEQFFTRAVDFGFSKSAKESFEKWGHDEVLSDVVRVIRTFRPDIIITRFPPTREAGHGHHEASAILAEEAFDLAGDPKAFPEQLAQGLEVWKPRRLFFNGSTWWKQNLAEIAKPDSGWYQVDVGGYDPLLGLSYTEIAGRSRSMHKSQGFGAAETKGELIEYLKFVAGEKPKSADIFEGIDMTWGRLPECVGAKVVAEKAARAFEPEHPERSIATLVELKNTWASSKDPWIAYARLRVDRLVADCAGLVIEVLSEQSFVTLKGPSDSLSLRVLVRNRTEVPLSVFASHSVGPFMGKLSVNKPFQMKYWPNQIGEREVDEPFWLRTAHTSLYNVKDAKLIGKAITPTNLEFDYLIDPEHAYSSGRTRTIRRWVDRVAGERIRPVYVTPVVSVIPKTDVLIARGGAQRIAVDVEALTDDITGTLTCTFPAGWSVVGNTSGSLEMGVTIKKRNEKNSFTLSVEPGANAKPGPLRFVFTGPKGTADRTLHEIDHPHILPQVYYTPAEVKLIPLDVKTTARTVGYIKGAGDDVPHALEQLGVKVEIIDASTATLESLGKYDAIVTGIRAYNTVQSMKALNPLLMTYVENGGTLVCQYNTKSSDMVLPDTLFGPYPFKLTRDRVTVEEAPPTFLAKDHPLLNAPNAITEKDFEGWVQERGLYFCGSLDPHYTPLIAWNDPGEQPLNGGLITCDFGKGRYVYTGISFFRELPAGVPGAYRLFANLISAREP